jgi:hypothetical protein
MCVSSTKFLNRFSNRREVPFTNRFILHPHPRSPTTDQNNNDPLSMFGTYCAVTNLFERGLINVVPYGQSLSRKIASNCAIKIRLPRNNDICPNPIGPRSVRAFRIAGNRSGNGQIITGVKIIGKK